MPRTLMVVGLTMIRPADEFATGPIALRLGDLPAPPARNTVALTRRSLVNQLRGAFMSQQENDFALCVKIAAKVEPISRDARLNGQEG